MVLFKQAVPSRTMQRKSTNRVSVALLISREEKWMGEGLSNEETTEEKHVGERAEVTVKGDCLGGC